MRYDEDKEKSQPTESDLDRLYYKIGKYVYEQHEKYKESDNRDDILIAELLQKIMCHAVMKK